MTYLAKNLRYLAARAGIKQAALDGAAYRPSAIAHFYAPAH